MNIAYKYGFKMNAPGLPSNRLLLVNSFLSIDVEVYWSFF